MSKAKVLQAIKQHLSEGSAVEPEKLAEEIHVALSSGKPEKKSAPKKTAENEEEEVAEDAE